MNTVETKVGSLWKGCHNDNAVRSGSRKKESMEPENLENGMAELVRSVGIIGQEIAIDVGKPTWRIIRWDDSNHSWEELDADSDDGCPSKFLIQCLNSIQNALELSPEEGRPFFTNSWGYEFWSCYNNGNDVLDTDGVYSKIEKIAWITSTATDSISMKEKEGVSLNCPFLLYLVPSQDIACKVLEVCKPLEALGVCTLFLHSGISIDLQIQSLKTSEPEFIISTPERLLELLSLKAVNVSDLSLMVIDGLEVPFGGTYLDAVKSMRQFISGNTQTVIFCSKAAGGSIC
ncbi:uncharacterized protein LOC131014755 [Salvia miltiorrhiza]|uniref:uncharacterized protein LOC131014755 n=1 Tax=Salvia miltiorrhiza TaxID=226208 RepID=UPI0025AD072F|nr:uncharacterized protein LOC131014755 [Salvia miltiorrhiza]XP_057798825.1 uncharacterized protein LOC131014755 [Salvia miltiorrhiza]